MYLLQVWCTLSDEGAEDAVYDSYAMRRFLRLDFDRKQVLDATTLPLFRHLVEEHGLGGRLLQAQNEIVERQGWIMRGGSIVDATTVASPSSTKNATGTRDPEMRQTKKGQQWYFADEGAHRPVDAGTGYVHSVTAAAITDDLDEPPNWSVTRPGASAFRNARRCSTIRTCQPWSSPVAGRGPDRVAARRKPARRPAGPQNRPEPGRNRA